MYASYSNRIYFLGFEGRFFKIFVVVQAIDTKVPIDGSKALYIGSCVDKSLTIIVDEKANLTLQFAQTNTTYALDAVTLMYDTSAKYFQNHESRLRFIFPTVFSGHTVLHLTIAVKRPL